MRKIFPAASRAIIQEARGETVRWRGPVCDATGAASARVHLNNWNERANGRVGVSPTKSIGGPSEFFVISFTNPSIRNSSHFRIKARRIVSEIPLSSFLRCEDRNRVV